METTFERAAVIFGLVLLIGVLASGNGRADDQVRLIDMPDFCWGMALSPDGSKLGVAVCGSIYGPYNHRMAVIDTAGESVSDETSETGNFPEEIAFRLSPGGGIAKIFVSNSADSTISVFRPDLSLEAIVDLTVLGPGLGDWPFGLLMGPQGRYLYVSTQNAGEIIGIDTQPGPTYLQIASHHTVGVYNGRMELDGNRLIIPGADYVNGAILSILDLAAPSQVETVVLQAHGGNWASANDVAVAGGCAYVPVLDYSGNMLLYEVDLALDPPAVTRTIDISPGYIALYEHGICASPDGNTLAVASLSGQLVFVGRKAGCLIADVDLTAYGNAWCNEAVFTLDGKKVFVTDQADPVVYVVGNIPAHGLWLDGPDSAAVGGQTVFEMAGGEAGEPGALWASLHLGPTEFPGFAVDIGRPIHRVFQGTFDAGCRISSIAVPIPANPNLGGKTIYFQGLARDADQETRPSNLHAVAIS